MPRCVKWTVHGLSLGTVRLIPITARTMYTMPNLVNSTLCAWSLCVLDLFFIATSSWAAEIATLTPTVQLTTPESKDQDDFCVWIHPQDRTHSAVIASDKSADKLFVYDLDGHVLQMISVPKPGNIDVRQQVTIDGVKRDIVVVNQRTDGFKLVVFRVDSQTRQLERIDDDCLTGPNYGGCLYISAKTGRLFFVCTSESGTVEQYELLGNGQHKVKATKVRTMIVGKCEGAVADDENASLFISEEQKGIWKFDAEPSGSVEGTLIASIGQHGLKGDVEGLAIFSDKDHPQASERDYLVVSDQGRNRFVAYQRKAPHQYVGEFSIEGASQTDGIEICSANLGPKFPYGLFACHTDQSPRCVLLTPWSSIAPRLEQAAADR